MERLGSGSVSPHSVVNETLACITCKTIQHSSKFLKCNHIICDTCLSERILGGSIECTACSILTPAPNGAADLDDNFLIQHYTNEEDIRNNIGISPCSPCCLGKISPSELYCIQCKRYMCNIDWNAHQNFYPGATSHVCIRKDIKPDQSLPPADSPQHCSLHPSSKLELYCNTCSSLACSSCVRINHGGHMVTGVDEALERERSDLSKCKESLEEKIDDCKQSLQQSEQKKRSLEEKRQTQKEEIENGYQERLAKLNNERDGKLNQMRTEFDNVINTLFIQTQQFESTLNQLYQAIRITESCPLLAQSKEEQLSLLPRVTDKLLPLTETVPKQKPVQPDQCRGASLSSAVVVPHKYSMQGKQPSFHFGANYNLNKIRGVSMGEEGKIFVVDKGNSLIHCFSPEGKQILAFGKLGRGPGEFKNPWGLCIHGKRLWISDNSVGNVVSFSLEGIYFCRFGTWGTAPGDFQSPKGISAGADGHIWVADCDNNRVQKLEQNGKPVDIVSSNDRFAIVKPVDVCVSLDNTVWILVGADPCIIHLNSEGNVLAQFGMFGKGRDLILPVSISYDESARCLLVADSAACHILSFSDSGVKEGKLSLKGIKPYTLHGVSTDGTGRVVCTAKEVSVFTLE